MPVATIRMKKIMPLLDPPMEDLPELVMVDILSRLPVKTIIHCKCVCKLWLDLVSDSYFADLHLSRSPAGIMFHHFFLREPKPGILKWLEVKDEVNDNHLHHDPSMSLDLNLAPILQESKIFPVGSVNGLICLWQYGRKIDNTCICNPITREYTILPRQQYYKKKFAHIVYCFGVGSLTREYKVIRIFQGSKRFAGVISRPKVLEAEVYTLGTGQWRSLGHVPYWLNDFHGPFLKGHGHWIVGDHDSPERICAFDFDKETFDLFPSPPFDFANQSLGVLKGCLCRCDTYDFKIKLWVMKEYGIKNSWHKEFVIKKSIIPALLMWQSMRIIDGLKDGTILLRSFEDELFAYCPRKKTVVHKKVYDNNINVLAYRPSFIDCTTLRTREFMCFKGGSSCSREIFKLGLHLLTPSFIVSKASCSMFMFFKFLG